MGETVTVRLSAEERKQIVRQAQKADEDLSEYIRKATEQRIARELQDQRTEELSLASELEQVADEVTAVVSKAADIETTEELAYEVALWDLISTEYPSEKRAVAMEEATEKLQEEVENVRNKGDEE
jgi:Na+/phosphate symporter